MKKSLIVSILFLYIISQTSFAQGFIVEDLSLNQSDLSASTNPRNDASGVPCGLIKVKTTEQGLLFDGNIIGDVENHINEYWVYLTKGTQEFTLTRPNYLPMTIRLADYGVDAISAKTTFILSLKKVNLDMEKCGVVIHARPYDANVSINGINLKTTSDGNYRVILPKGEHLCSISAKGYKSDNKIVSCGKGIQTIEINLESILADVDIISLTENAEILVDNISKGIGRWSGKLLPGRHYIMAQQKGYVATTRIITLTPKGNCQVIIPFLKNITSSIEVSSVPNGCKVYFDGSYYSTTPCSVPNIIYGQHLLKLVLDSCGIKRNRDCNVVINESKGQTVNIELVDKKTFKSYEDAFNWFTKGLEIDSEDEFRDFEMDDYIPPKEKNIWYEKIISVINLLEPSFFLEKVTLKLPCYDKLRNEGIDFNGTVVCKSTIGRRLVRYYLTLLHNPESAAIIAEKIEIPDFMLLGIAKSFYLQKKYNKAIEWHHKYFNCKVPTTELLVIAYRDMGQCYMEIKRADEAVKCFNKSKSLEKNAISWFDIEKERLSSGIGREKYDCIRVLELDGVDYYSIYE